MSSQAIASPDELEEFARALDQFTRQLVDSMRRLQGSLARLETTWRDVEQQRFRQEFDQAFVALSRFAQVSDRQVPILRDKARHLQDYLNRR